ncbi:hypothetical protein CYMTET_10829 [Cymbomonas tetramitiformis]|uniref:Dolichol-phosphate mannosyltransferase subunit 3 n=1 Tax=Cymbomonas tetramitiformis TaxID=36881 RepID=A0AAE0GNG9_9CHLO|nr:hypothetical protein CYMTET_10829 [Cymbomonas tetramitiformis]
MLRIVRLLGYFCTVTLVWLASLQLNLSDSLRAILQILPLYALVSFGLYSLGVIGLSILTFPTCEGDSLKKDILDAETDLRKLGVMPLDSVRKQK